ncbi:hypothetical protein [Halomarina rubra]|uniref:DUF1059 domain-containing protein n=1 Tax=Halomarina rubra TaxID=2071873 RepID=A0ABD6AXN5_9EURY|nr:hypothetical protein [Halomarina rubra]
MREIWQIDCRACSFRGRAETESVAEALADVHRGPTDHHVHVYPTAGVRVTAERCRPADD